MKQNRKNAKGDECFCMLPSKKGCLQDHRHSPQCLNDETVENIHSVILYIISVSVYTMLRNTICIQQ